MFLRVRNPIDIATGRDVVVDSATFVIGRDADCDLRLTHPTVSRHHCMLSSYDRSVTVRDLGSTNGTYIVGYLIKEEHLLRPGDVLSLGKVELEVLNVATAPALDSLSRDSVGRVRESASVDALPTFASADPSADQATSEKA